MALDQANISWTRHQKHQQQQRQKNIKIKTSGAPKGNYLKSKKATHRRGERHLQILYLIRN